jgi:spoIIIJ-associated protein
LRKEITETAKTVEAAIDMACMKLGCKREDCEFEIIDLPKKQFFGLKMVPAKVKVWFEAPDERPARPPREQRPQQERRPAAEQRQAAPKPQQQKPRQEQPAKKPQAPVEKPQPAVQAKPAEAAITGKSRKRAHCKGLNWSILAAMGLLKPRSFREKAASASKLTAKSWGHDWAAG